MNQYEDVKITMNWRSHNDLQWFRIKIFFFIESPESISNVGNTSKCLLPHALSGCCLHKSCCLHLVIDPLPGVLAVIRTSFQKLSSHNEECTIIQPNQPAEYSIRLILWCDVTGLPFILTIELMEPWPFKNLVKIFVIEILLWFGWRKAIWTETS